MKERTLTCMGRRVVRLLMMAVWKMGVSKGRRDEREKVRRLQDDDDVEESVENSGEEGTRTREEWRGCDDSEANRNLNSRRKSSAFQTIMREKKSHSEEETVGWTDGWISGWIGGKMG